MDSTLTYLINEQPRLLIFYFLPSPLQPPLLNEKINIVRALVNLIAKWLAIWVCDLPALLEAAHLL